MSALDDYFAAQLKRVEASNDCADLEAIAASQEAVVAEMLSKIAAQITQLEAMVVVPTNLSQVISWIENLIGQYNTALTNAIAQQAAITSAQTELLAAIAARYSSLQCSF